MKKNGGLYKIRLLLNYLVTGNKNNFGPLDTWDTGGHL